MDDQKPLTRREMARLAWRASLLPAGASFFESWMRAAHHEGNNSAPPDPHLLRDYSPSFFSPEDFAALSAFTEILIPSDDSPGAREANCALFIDFVLHASDEVPKTQARWRDAMQELRATGFHAADPVRRVQIVKEMSRPEVDRSAQHRAFPAYLLIKSQTAFAFYTSRVGMIEVLDYKGNSYNVSFPACNHPEHQTISA